MTPYRYSLRSMLPATSIAGAWSGIQQIHPGDALEWECDIQNDGTNPLPYSTETMCGFYGASVGASVRCLLP